MTPYSFPGTIGRKLTMNEAYAVLLKHFDTTDDLMKSKKRKREVLEKRQSMMFLLRWYGFTLESVGVCFLKDHATVLHSCRMANNDMQMNMELLEKNEQLMHGKLRKDLHVITVKNVTIVGKESQEKLNSSNGLHYFNSIDHLNAWVMELKSDFTQKIGVEVECHLTYVQSNMAKI